MPPTARCAPRTALGALRIARRAMRATPLAAFNRRRFALGALRIARRAMRAKPLAAGASRWALCRRAAHIAVRSVHSAAQRVFARSAPWPPAALCAIRHASRAWRVALRYPALGAWRLALRADQSSSPRSSSPLAFQVFRRWMSAICDLRKAEVRLLRTLRMYCRQESPCRQARRAAST